VLAKKTQLILDTPEHVDSENIKFKIDHRSGVYQLFKKRDFSFIKCLICGLDSRKNLVEVEAMTYLVFSN
jgi:hypothetical protein